MGGCFQLQRNSKGECTVADETAVEPAKKSKADRTRDKMTKVLDEIERAQRWLEEHEERFIEAKTDAAREKAQAKRDEVTAKIAGLRREHRRLEITARYEDAQEGIRKARAVAAEVELEALTAPETHDDFVRTMTAMVEEVINDRATMSRIKGRSDELTDLIRAFVAAHPTGWVAGVEDPERKYLCWISPDGRYQVILEDNPLYELTVDQIVQLLGFKDAVQFLKVDYTAVRDAAKNGLLKGTDGQPISLDRIRELRQRTERTKKVKAMVRGPGLVEEIVEVVAPDLVEAFVEGLEILGLDRNIINALGTAGITRVGQVRCLSGDDLAKIKGIGPSRAAAIIKAVVRRVS